MKFHEPLGSIESTYGGTAAVSITYESGRSASVELDVGGVPLRLGPGACAALEARLRQAREQVDAMSVMGTRTTSEPMKEWDNGAERVSLSRNGARITTLYRVRAGAGSREGAAVFVGTSDHGTSRFGMLRIVAGDGRDASTLLGAGAATLVMRGIDKVRERILEHYAAQQAAEAPGGRAAE